MLINHPALIEAHWEEVAALEFESKRLAAFRDALVALPPRRCTAPRRLAEALAAAGQGEERERILGACRKNAQLVVSSRRGGAAPTPSTLLRQSLALHRRAGALHRELKIAERSLAAEPTEQNFARLLDIKTHLADLADAEAAIDGFGEHSGRASSAI